MQSSPMEVKKSEAGKNFGKEFDLLILGHMSIDHRKQRKLVWVQDFVGFLVGFKNRRNAMITADCQKYESGEMMKEQT